MVTETMFKLKNVFVNAEVNKVRLTNVYKFKHQYKMAGVKMDMVALNGYSVLSRHLFKMF